MVRLPFTFPPLLPRKQLKRFRISLHNGSHQQSETNLYWSLGGRSTRKPRKRLRPSRHRHPRTTPGPTGSQLPPIPTFSTSLPRPTVEFGIQPSRKYLKKKKNGIWNSTSPIPDSNPRDLATSSISIHESFQSHSPNPLSIRESFQSHFSIRESFQSHFFEPVSDPRLILVPKLVAHFSNPSS